LAAYVPPNLILGGKEEFLDMKTPAFSLAW
jgi:hypothetical protein